MGLLAVISTLLMLQFQLATAHGARPRSERPPKVEQRFPALPDSAIFASATTLTSTGCGGLVPQLLHTSLSGMMAMFNMQLGEAAPGGNWIGPLRNADPRGDHRFRRRSDGRGRTPEYLEEDHLAKSSSPQAFPRHAADRFRRGRPWRDRPPGERAAMLNSGPHGLSGSAVRVHFRLRTMVRRSG